MRSSRLMSSRLFFASKFIDVSNLVVLFCMFWWRYDEEACHVVVRAFRRYYSFCPRRQKCLVAVLFLECSLLTSSEMHLLLIGI